MESFNPYSPETIEKLQHRKERLKEKDELIEREVLAAIINKPKKEKLLTREKYYTYDATGQSITTFSISKSKTLEKKADDCKCVKIEGHLEAVKWLLWPRSYKPSPGHLLIEDWMEHPFIWMHYVQRSGGNLPDDEIFLHESPPHWDTSRVQRYFLGDFHCEQALFSYQYPNLKLPSRYGSHLWKINSLTKKQNPVYMKEFGLSLDVTLKKMEMSQTQMDRLIISDQLIKLETMEHFKRQAFFNNLLKIISYQENLQLVSFENLRCKRLEGVRLIQQLACFNADTLRYLFLWGFVDCFENPILINYTYITGTGKYIPRPDTKQCFLRCLGEFKNLRILSLEYSHIADDSGAALISLLSIIKRPHFRLHLMCRSKHIPNRNDPSLGCGGKEIPDKTWRRIQFVCPNLYLSIAFFRIREFDDLRRILTPSIPLNDVHLSMGIDLYKKQRQTSDVTCFVRHIAYRYASYLVSVSIHQWRFSSFPLRCLFKLIPRLERFFYVGVVENEGDIRKMLYLVSTGVCHNLKMLKIFVQDDLKNRDYWRTAVRKINEDYKDVMNLFDIKFTLEVYKT